MWFWHTSKKDVEVWIESKKKEFIEKENINPNLSAEDWLQRYIFSDLHKVFFTTFPTELHAWLSRLAENKNSSHSEKPMEWTLEVI